MIAKKLYRVDILVGANYLEVLVGFSAPLSAFGEWQNIRRVSQKFGRFTGLAVAIFFATLYKQSSHGYKWPWASRKDYSVAVSRTLEVNTLGKAQYLVSRILLSVTPNIQKI